MKLAVQRQGTASGGTARRPTAWRFSVSLSLCFDVCLHLFCCLLKKPKPSNFRTPSSPSSHGYLDQNEEIQKHNEPSCSGPSANTHTHTIGNGQVAIWNLKIPSQPRKWPFGGVQLLHQTRTPKPSIATRLTSACRPLILTVES